MATKARTTKAPAKRSAPLKAARPTHLEPLTTVAVDGDLNRHDLNQLGRGHDHDHDQDHDHDHNEEPVPAAFRALLRYRGDLSWIVSIIGLLTLRESSPWAILVVSFNDD